MLSKGILFYTDNRLNMKMAKTCREYISQSGLPITSVSLKPMNFGKNIHFQGERGYKTLFKQIQIGLESMTEDIVYFCEHDTLYHPNHFEFTPKDMNTFYYNGNYWFLRLNDGFSVHYDVSPLSGLVANREILLKHFKERNELIDKQGFGYYMGFEPMTHNRIDWKHKYPFEVFIPENPNIDLCHGNNLTWKRWSKKHFRKQPKFWEESNVYNIKGWSNLVNIVSPFSDIKPKEYKDETLSIIIPARNEMFLGKTIEDLLKNIEGKTEIIVVLDGYNTPIPQIPNDKRVIILGYHESIGQREATNQAVKLSKSKYIMKVDAHCAFDKGFDVKMMREMRDDWTMVPVMRNLHVFNWICPDGHSRYQSPSGVCRECGKETKMDVVWIAKTNPQSTSYCFDSEPHFQYFNEFKKRPEGRGEITETMSLQGSCFMCTREKYLELNLSDNETFGSWGSQGIEVACKTWLSGGRVVVNHKTWYAHMFRTQGGDFSFPYAQSGSQVERAKKQAKELFFNNKWEKQIRPLSWLLERFWPVPGWTEEQLKELKRNEVNKYETVEV
jgi:glycosyltransferase involved in cell wall biosynthesis